MSSREEIKKAIEALELQRNLLFEIRRKELLCASVSLRLKFIKKHNSHPPSTNQ